MSVDVQTLDENVFFWSEEHARASRESLHTTPDDATHWSTRSLADQHGVGKDTVARIWDARNLKPWLVDTFKLSTR